MKIDNGRSSAREFKAKGGIRTHLILGLTVFVLLILAVIWIFQVLLLDFFYERTKLNQLDDVLSYIADKSYSEKYGARNMRRFIERNVEDKLANVILENYNNNISGISVSVQNDDIKIDFI